jgi:hypothetical protein
MDRRPAARWGGVQGCVRSLASLWRLHLCPPPPPPPPPHTHTCTPHTYTHMHTPHTDTSSTHTRHHAIKHFSTRPHTTTTAPRPPTRTYITTHPLPHAHTLETRRSRAHVRTRTRAAHVADKTLVFLCPLTPPQHTGAHAPAACSSYLDACFVLLWPGVAQGLWAVRSLLVCSRGFRWWFVRARFTATPWCSVAPPPSRRAWHARALLNTEDGR